MNTSDMLDALAKIGRPTLCRLDTGWYASIKFPAPEGVTMEMRSDFAHPTHESALLQLMARLDSVVEIGSTISKAITVQP